jgi:hypothetical protein
VSDSALKKMKHVIKRVWRFRNRTDLSLEQIAEIMNPSVRGWFNYYGKFYKSRLQIIARYINTHLVKWARSHFRRQHSDRQKMFDWLRNEYCRRPRLMSHWEILRFTDGSRMTRECPVRFYEQLGVRFPRLTHREFDSIFAIIYKYKSI